MRSTRRPHVDLRVPLGRLNGGRAVHFPHRCIVCCEPATLMRLLATQVEDDRAMPTGARITNRHAVDLMAPYCTPHARRVDRLGVPWRRGLAPFAYWRALAYRPYAAKVTDGMVLMRFLFRNARYAREFEDANEAWLAFGWYQGLEASRMRHRMVQRT